MALDSSAGTRSRERDVEIRWGIVAAILVSFLVIDHLQQILRQFDAYLDLYRQFPFYVPEGGKSLLQIALCFAATWLLCSRKRPDAASELGILGNPLTGIAFGLAATLPDVRRLCVYEPLLSTSVRSHGLLRWTLSACGGGSMPRIRLRTSVCRWWITRLGSDHAELGDFRLGALNRALSFRSELACCS